jgi:hypothetical protein
MIPKKPTKEESYQYLITIFTSGGVDTEEKVDEHIQGLLKKSRRATCIPLAALAVGSIFASKFLFFWVFFSLMGTAWIWSSALMTVNLMRRYKTEELNKPTGEDNAAGDDDDTTEEKKSITF